LQNAQAYQVQINTSHKRHCRASGFVLEPTSPIAAMRTNDMVCLR
jgi:hypothetical protein